MEKPFDLIILSAFERGAWLAANLSRQGMRVAFVDVTDQLGIHRRSDWEGPFGVHVSKDLRDPDGAHASLWEFLKIHEMTQLESGLTAWLSSGPVEFSSPQLTYRLGQLGVHPQILELMISGESGLQNVHRSVLQQDRKRMWPLWLSTQFSQNSFDPFKGVSTTESIPLQSPYWLRRVEVDQVEKTFAWLEQNGVKTFAQARLLDVSREGRRISALEIAHENSGILHAEQIVWTLSSLETERVIPTSYSKIYASSPAIPEWEWTHYGLQIEVNDLSEAMTDQWIAIDDLGLPWTHDNFVIGLRGRARNQWDIWVRRPTNQRFQRSYIEQLGQNIVARLKQRLLKTNVQVHLYPLEIELDEKILGPVRFPLFEPGILENLRPANLAYFHFLTHEATKSHRLAIHLRASQACAEAAANIWKKEILKRTKKGMTDDRTLPTA